MLLSWTLPGFESWMEWTQSHQSSLGHLNKTAEERTRSKKKRTNSKLGWHLVLPVLVPHFYRLLSMQCSAVKLWLPDSHVDSTWHTSHTQTLTQSNPFPTPIVHYKFITQSQVHQDVGWFWTWSVCFVLDQISVAFIGSSSWTKWMMRKNVRCRYEHAKVCHG